MKLVDLNDGVVISYYPNRMVCSSKKVIEQLKKYIQLSSCSTEAGGLLIGYERGNHFEITNITYPYKEDIRDINYFERKDKKHINTLKYIRKLSLGAKSYLGEWHTHPEPNPRPSSLDITEWKKTANYNEDILLFLIVGQETIFIQTSDQI